MDPNDAIVDARGHPRVIGPRPVAVSYWRRQDASSRSGPGSVSGVLAFLHDNVSQIPYRSRVNGVSGARAKAQRRTKTGEGQEERHSDHADRTG
jgi:hypothetical protein